MAITRINRFRAKPDSAAAVNDFLRSVIARIVDAPGCRSCELFVQRDDLTRLTIIEVWDSLALLRLAPSKPSVTAVPRSGGTDVRSSGTPHSNATPVYTR